jgi:phosphoribosylglycinamide formyltransferase-1
MARRRVGILISGGGSNMAALIAAAAMADFPAEIAVVISNRPDAGGLAKAAAAGIKTAVVDHKAYPDRPSFEDAIDAVLAAHGVELVCLAGFMRLLTPSFVTRWHDRMLNIHPALLPSYKGLHTHERALADGVKIAGATVHLVRPEMDVGPIIAQGAVPVLADDTAETLAARVLTVEHRIYPLALRLIASGAARIDGERVLVDGGDDTARLVVPTV